MLGDNGRDIRLKIRQRIAVGVFMRALQKKDDELQFVSVSVPVAARLLGISARTAWKLVKAGELPSFRIGSRVLIPYSAITSFVDERLAAARGA